MVLSGLAGAAWLAGIAAAHADPIAESTPAGADAAAGTFADPEGESSLSPASTSLFDAAAAVSEQAALSPAIQLESAVSPATYVSGELSDSDSDHDVASATFHADASNDASADAVDDSTTLAGAAGGLFSSLSSDGEADAAATDLGEPPTLVHTAVEPLSDVAQPLTMATEPVAANADAVTVPVAGVLTELPRPDAAATAPLRATLGQAATPTITADPGVGHGLSSLFTSVGPVSGSADPAAFAVDRVLAVDVHEKQRTDAPAEVGHSDVDSAPQLKAAVKPDVSVDRLGDSPQHSVPAALDYFGFAATGPSTGASLATGGAPQDGGVGLALRPASAGSDAEVSRVTPMTAVIGQLPDHVEDPAVSPD